jgi:hypothetical protein
MINTVQNDFIGSFNLTYEKYNGVFHQITVNSTTNN